MRTALLIRLNGTTTDALVKHFLTFTDMESENVTELYNFLMFHPRALYDGLWNTSGSCYTVFNISQLLPRIVLI